MKRETEETLRAGVCALIEASLLETSLTDADQREVIVTALVNAGFILTTERGMPPTAYTWLLRALAERLELNMVAHTREVFEQAVGVVSDADRRNVAELKQEAEVALESDEGTPIKP